MKVSEYFTEECIKEVLDKHGIVLPIDKKQRDTAFRTFNEGLLDGVDETGEISCLTSSPLVSRFYLAGYEIGEIFRKDFMLAEPIPAMVYAAQRADLSKIPSRLLNIIEEKK